MFHHMSAIELVAWVILTIWAGQAILAIIHWFDERSAWKLKRKQEESRPVGVFTDPNHRWGPRPWWRSRAH